MEIMKTNIILRNQKQLKKVNQRLSDAADKKRVSWSGFSVLNCHYYFESKIPTFFKMAQGNRLEIVIIYRKTESDGFRRTLGKTASVSVPLVDEIASCCISTQMKS